MQFSNLKRSQMKDSKNFYCTFFYMDCFIRITSNLRFKTSPIFVAMIFENVPLFLKNHHRVFKFSALKKISTCLWWPWNVEFSQLQFETNSRSEISITANFPREINHRFRWRYILFCVNWMFPLANYQYSRSHKRSSNESVYRRKIWKNLHMSSWFILWKIGWTKQH